MSQGKGKNGDYPLGQEQERKKKKSQKPDASAQRSEVKWKNGNTRKEYGRVEYKKFMGQRAVLMCKETES